VRTVMRACIYSKTLLHTRISKAFIDLSENLSLPEQARIIVVGSSGTVHYALETLISTHRDVTILPTRPTPEHMSSYKKLGAKIESVDAAAASAALNARNVHLVIIGCAVIGKTSRTGIEVVNWARDIALAKEAHRQGLTVVVVGALYKIWPQSFYEANKGAALSAQEGSPL